MFGFINDLIREPVGNNMVNDKDDVRSVKNRLGRLGRFTEEEPHGIITRDLDNAIKSFQRERNLRVDGILRPGGETERALQIDMFAQNAPPVPERKPEPPTSEPAPEREEKRENEEGKEEEKRRKENEQRCAQLGKGLFIARERQRRREEDLTKALERINLTLQETRDAEANLIKVRANTSLNTALSAGRGLPGVLMTGATALIGKSEVDRARKKAALAKERHETAKSHLAFVQREIEQIQAEIEQIEAERNRAGCS